MSENRTKNYEMKCLLELISAIVNVEAIPKWKRKPEWGEIYKLADYHSVANFVYYGILPMEDAAISVWKEKFEERFHASVLSDERYTAILPEIINNLIEQNVHFLILKNYQMREYYPHTDMRLLKAVEILVEKDKREKIQQAMYWLDFEEREVREEEGICYYKIPGIWVIFREELSFTNKKMRKYFSLSPKDYEKVSGFKYFHLRGPEEQYIYVMGSLAESYAKGSLDVRDMLDIWYYYFAVYKKLDWGYVTKEFEKLEIKVFSECIIKLAAFWFGEMVFPAESELFSAMEKYILTKGIQGRAESSKLLPLVKEVADFYKRDMRRERMQRMLNWVFPKLDYMDILFPILKSWKLLLPACWILRLLRSLVRTLELRWLELMQKMKEKWLLIWHPICEKCKWIYSKCVEKWDSFRKRFQSKFRNRKDK